VKYDYNRTVERIPKDCRWGDKMTEIDELKELCESMLDTLKEFKAESYKWYKQRYEEILS